MSETSFKMPVPKAEFDELLYKITLPQKENYTSNANDSLSEENNACHNTPVTYNTTIGILIAVPEWEAITTALILSILIIGTIFGNILVILGVFTHRPLRIVQNFFIVSLAVADLTVAILVLPFNVAYSILGRWHWGEGLCKMWLTCDILCCTSSILNLCVIALDRYWAITDPINYANKRTFKRVIALIAGVWILSLLISSPPLLGWNDWIDEFTVDTPCRLTSERGYVIYSASGSFFIPLVIMTIVYIKIYVATKQRLRRRTQASKACAGNDKPAVTSEKDVVELQDIESMNSESNPNEENESDSSNRAKKCQKREFTEIKRNFFVPLLYVNNSDRNENDQDQNHPENIDNSSGSSNKILSVVRRMSKKSKRDKKLLATVDKKGDVIHQFIEEKQKISLSKERRAARTLGIIMGVFVVCWLPFFMMYVILAFCESCCTTDRLINFITWLGYVNSTVNPLIYTIFNLDFRKAFKKLLTSKKN